MNIEELSGLLQNNMKKFLTGLEETFQDTECYEEIVMMKYILMELPLPMLIDQFNKYVIPYRSMITDRDEKFFLKDDKVFAKIKQDGIVEKIKMIWKGEISADTKESIWLWFEKFIKIVDKINKVEKQ